jgi:hypothetical protein
MHYVICIDGTWNAPGQDDINPLSNQQIVTETNVLRVFRGLTGISPNPKFELGHTASLMSNDGQPFTSQASEQHPEPNFSRALRAPVPRQELWLRISS